MVDEEGKWRGGRGGEKEGGSDCVVVFQATSTPDWGMVGWRN